MTTTSTRRSRRAQRQSIARMYYDTHRVINKALREPGRDAEERRNLLRLRDYIESCIDELIGTNDA